MRAQKILATLTLIGGSMAVIYALFAAAGLEVNVQLQDAITGAVGLVLAIAGIWFHPSIPVGDQPPPG